MTAHQDEPMNKEDKEKLKRLKNLEQLYHSFDLAILSGMTPTYLNSKTGVFKCDFKVGEPHINGFNKMHGGVIAAIVDLLGSYALLALQPENEINPGVSTDLNVSYFNGCDLGNTVVVESRILKHGKLLVFIQVDIRDQKTGVLLAQGRHTKAITRPKDYQDKALKSKL
jgi:acyl-coenzyme A thioesterase 13